MSTGAPRCRTVRVFTFRGDRATIGPRVQREIDDQKPGRGHGPTPLNCLLYAAHTGVSIDSGKTIYGFNPDIANVPIWQAMQTLKNGGAFPGVVRDDAPVFTAANDQKLRLMTFDVVLPDPAFRTFERKLRAERKKSRYSYGFPNGDGDCNCTTWLERLGLPLLTGSMDEFSSLLGFAYYPVRRFGACV